MKNTSLFVCLLLSQICLFAQTDHEEPVYYSVSTGEQDYKDCKVQSNYYPLHNNIENPLSSLFISVAPYLDEIEKAATEYPSNFYLLSKDHHMIAILIRQEHPEQGFIVVRLKSGEQEFIAWKLEGDISENRANEIMDQGYDMSATLTGTGEGSILYFNSKKFKVIENETIEQAALALIKQKKLHKVAPSDFKIRPKSELKAYILAESKAGNKLDFFTEIAGHEYDGIQVKPGLFATKLSLALYKWGRACLELGVNTVEDAYEIYAAHKEGALSEKEKGYIKRGFYQEWEKPEIPEITPKSFPTNFSHKDLDSLASRDGRIVALEGKIAQIEVSRNNTPCYKMELGEGKYLWTILMFSNERNELGDTIRVVGMVAEILEQRPEEAYLGEAKYLMIAYGLADLTSGDVRFIKSGKRAREDWINGKIPRLD